MKTANTQLIRKMNKEDLNQVFIVRTSTSENAITMDKLSSYGITIDTVSTALNNDVCGWVCELNDQIVGFCMGNKTTAEMQVLAVLPEYEGKGYAAKLMAEVQSWLFKQGHQTLWLLTTPDKQLRAYGFYQYLGWQATGILIDGEEKFTLNRIDFHQKA